MRRVIALVQKPKPALEGYIGAGDNHGLLQDAETL